MYLSELRLWNFRRYGTNGEGDFEKSAPGLTIWFQNGVNVLIGENNSGKTAVIDAIRYILHTKSGEYIAIDEKDFYKPQNADRSSSLKIECIFRGLTANDAGLFLECLSVEDIKNGTSMPRNMFLFTNANYLLPYTGAGSGVRRALEYDPVVTFSNGINDREITHTANEFVITIPRKTEQVTNQASLVPDPVQTKNDQAQTETDPVSPKSEQPTDLTAQNTTKLTQNTDPASPKSEQPTNQVAQNKTKLAQNTDPVQSGIDPVSDQPIGNTDPAQAKNDPVSDQPIGNTDPAQAKNDPVSDQPTPNKTKLKLFKKQQDIRNFCTVPRNRQEILQRAGVTDHFDNRKKYIYDLVKAGVLERTIPDKPNDPNQKYRRKQ